MLGKMFAWFRRNAYGVFALRVIVALGSAAVSVLLSFLPYDTALQAAWVVVSSLFMGSLVLRQRLNETDDVRYRRLFRSRFAFLQANDPEALVTVFSENLRPRVMDWFQTESGISARQIPSFDALDSLARCGDTPGQLIFRTGIKLGQWLPEIRQAPDPAAELELRLQQFVMDQAPLLGEKVAPGIYLRHIQRGEHRPVGVHLFHPDSRVLLTVEYYDDQVRRHAIALSAKSQLFETGGDEQFQAFQKAVHREFPCFQPARGGSGPQKAAIPFFVGSIDDHPVASDEVLRSKLLTIAESLPPVPAESETPPETASEA